MGGHQDTGWGHDDEDKISKPAPQQGKTHGEQLAEDVKLHGGALGGAAIGGAIGFFFFGLGAIPGAAIGGVIGHFAMDRQRK